MADRKTGAEAKSAAVPAGQKKKKNKQIGTPPAWLWYPVLAVVGLVYRLVYGVRVNRTPIRGVKGPALVLAPHLSGKDHVLTAMALFPRRPTYVLSEHFRTTKPMRFVCRLMHTVTKKMFCSDTRAVLGIIRAVREGNTVVLFPEGRLTWYGRSLALTAGTAELVKQLKVPVLTVTSNGAGKTFPKWAAKKRHGKIQIETELLLTAEQIASLTPEQIETVLEDALRHDEEKVLTDIPFRTGDTAAGLDGILWKCPGCGGTRSMTAARGQLQCSGCGLSWTLDAYGRFHGGSEAADLALREAGIGCVADFYEYCASFTDTSVPFVTPVTVSGTDADGYMRRAIGEGTFTVGRDEIRFEGTLDGKPDSFTVPTDRVAAFPVTVGDHVDIYRDGRLLWMEPSPDRRRAIELVAYLDSLHAGARKGTEEKA